MGVEDVLRRSMPNQIVIDMHTFCAEPVRFLDQIYSMVGQDPFDHDLMDIENACGETDGIYLNKYPHEGSGKVEQRGDDWREFVDPDLAAQILGRYPYYCQRLGYR
jgi:hypothetical protein